MCFRIVVFAAPFARAGGIEIAQRDVFQTIRGVVCIEDTFYHHDQVGCQVMTQDGQNVGMVEGVEGTLEGSRLVVSGATGEILIPLVKDICRTIDVAGKRIVIDPPDGLLDLNA